MSTIISQYIHLLLNNLFTNLFTYNQKNFKKIQKNSKKIKKKLPIKNQIHQKNHINYIYCISLQYY